MPPRAAKKSPAGPGMKRAGRAARGTPRAQNKPEVAAEESVAVEEVKAEEVTTHAAEIREEETVKVEEKRAAAERRPEAVEPEKQVKPMAVEVKAAEENGVVSAKKEDGVKESADDYERGERLDLDDNDPEYETEEYGGVDYDEKEIEHEHVQEGDVVEEETEEEDVGEEEEGDMVEEEGDVHEEINGEDDEEHAGEEHEEMIGAEAAAEEEEHHKVFKERRKRKEFEIFVGGLDKDATEDDLMKVFSQVGEVTEVRLMMNPQTKKNKGFAFLRFATVEQAKCACAELKHPVVNGKQCGVTPSQDSDTLFLGNLCKTWTKEALRDKLKHYGVENIDDLTLVEDSNNPGMNRGFAFLEFSSRSDAMDAFKRLQKRDVVFGVDRPAKVSFADSFIEPGDEIMAQVKTIFVDGLPASWDEGRVQELLKQYGKIEKVELARNMPSARRKDFGFVTFDSHGAAVNCAKSINNEELGEGDNKAKVRARLSRPLQRGKGKHISRGDSRYGRAPTRSVKDPLSRPARRSVPSRGTRGLGARRPPIQRPASFRDRRPVMAPPSRSRPVAPPLPRVYDRRVPVPSFPKSSLKRSYGRREEIPPRSRPVADCSPRVPSDKRTSYRDDYPSREPGYPDMSRGTARPAARRAYVDDSYGQRYERPPPAYREGRSQEYDSMSGSKRPYSALDDIPPRYSESMRHSRARLDYEFGSSASRYGDAYGDRLGRSSLGYGSSRSSNSGQDPHGLYSSRQGMSYSGGSYGSSEVGGMYSSGYGGDYMSRGGDVDQSSYSSLYSGRGLGGSSYMGSGGSGSYY